MISEVPCRPNTMSLGVKQGGKREAEDEWGRRWVCAGHNPQPCAGDSVGIQESSQG